MTDSHREGRVHLIISLDDDTGKLQVTQVLRHWTPSGQGNQVKETRTVHLRRQGL